jgi:hypothetical protein
MTVLAGEAARNHRARGLNIPVEASPSQRKDDGGLLIEQIFPPAVVAAAQHTHDLAAVCK